jgi:hypothetical protein
MVDIDFRLKLELRGHINSVGATLFVFLCILNTNHIAHGTRVDRVNLIENHSLQLRLMTKCAYD